MHTIYLDMDGVIADWHKFADQVLGPHEYKSKYPPEDWEKMRLYPRLYRDLPVMDNAVDFVNETLKLASRNDMDVKFLTAVPSGNDVPWAFHDKVHWAHQYFPGVPVWFGPYSKDKQIRATRWSALVDDREKNIRQWVEAGGIGILYEGDLLQTLKQLQDIYK